MAFTFLPGKIVQVPDLPYKDHVNLVSAKTALIIVDMQNDFVKQGGSLVVEAAKDTIASIRTLMDIARTKAVKIV